MTNPISEMFRLQGQACANLGSPFYAELCTLVSAATARGDDLRGLLAPWAGADLPKVAADAVPLRLLGGLHDLVLSGDDEALAATFPRPGAPAEAAAAWSEAQLAIGRWRDRLARFMEHEPQTNEVRRSICLVGGFLEVARLTGLPLRTFELGASGGLNLFWEQFDYRFGEATWGGGESGVKLDSDWQGSAPAVDAQVVVVSRAACDRRPVLLDDPVQRRRLLAYLWPDQFERMDRIRAAIELAVTHDVAVDEADAPIWTAERAAPQAGAATVLYHSVFWQYMPAESQAVLRTTIDAFAAQATADAAFAWLRMEPPADDLTKPMEVRLTLWPGGAERKLAEVHAHGAWVRWLA